jgi:hypothetical protein
VNCPAKSSVFSLQQPRFLTKPSAEKGSIKMRSMMLCAAGLLVVGCGEATQPPEAVFPVTGVITFQGAPVVGADVTFHNEDKKRSAFGRTNDKG